MSTGKLILVLIGGLGVLLFMLVHPIGPALFVVALTPFEGLLYIFFGFYGNLLNLAPLLVFLIRPMRGGVLNAFLGTQVQRAAALMVLSMAVSFMITIDTRGPQAMIGYASTVYLFLLVAILVPALSDERYLPLAIKVYVISMTAWVVISALDFYLGLHLFPSTDALTLADASSEGPAHRWRLRGAGGGSSNRLALQLLLPLLLSVGWVAHPGRTRALSLVCSGILALGLVGTVSRSGILGAGVGALVIASRTRMVNVVVAGFFAVVVGLAGITLAGRMGVTEAIEGRFSGDLVASDASARSDRWMHGLRLFAQSPLIGVGDGVEETREVRATAHATDPHNGYIRHLAWTGLLGFSFLVYFLIVTARTLMGSKRGVPDEIAHWRTYFLGALAAVAVMNLFVSYLVERFLFVIAAYAAGLERVTRPVLDRPPGVTSPFLEDAETTAHPVEDSPLGGGSTS